MKTGKKFYITTAIDYVNAAPHVGHAYEKICADVIARWHRLRGEEVFFLTGTDENAQKNVKAAKEADMNIKEFVDRNAELFKRLCFALNVSNDDFIRTTEERHVKASQEIFQKLYDKGLIYKSNYEGLYCDGCEAFLTKKDLVDGKCPEHGKEPRELKEEAYFFRLGNFRDRITSLVEAGLVSPDSRKNEILSRLNSEKLKDICVSRTEMEWGIPTPVDADYRIYVWIDALVNYLSAAGYPEKKFEESWPADVHLIGKGINWFHSVIWPAILMGCDISPPKKVLVHGYVTINGKKIGKSLGNVIDPMKLVEKYPADALRYFLVREIPFGEDGDFSEESMVDRINNELNSNYGNLFYRVTSFVEKNFGSVPEPSEKGEKESMLENTIKNSVEKVGKLMENFLLTEALREIMALSAETNKYFQEKEPWKKMKNDPQDAATTLYYSVNALNTISIMLYPFVPKISERALKLLDISLITKEILPHILKEGTGAEDVKFDATGIWKKAGSLCIKPGSKIFSDILIEKIEQIP